MGMRYTHSPSNSSEVARFVAFESINTVINSATSFVPTIVVTSLQI